MSLDDKKVKVYSLLMDSFLKFICGLTVLTLMIVVFCYWINSKNDIEFKRYGIIEGAFDGLFIFVVAHYFRTKGK